MAHLEIRGLNLEPGVRIGVPSPAGHLEHGGPIMWKDCVVCTNTGRIPFSLLLPGIYDETTSQRFMSLLQFADILCLEAESLFGFRYSTRSVDQSDGNDRSLRCVRCPHQVYMIEDSTGLSSTLDPGFEGESWVLLGH